MSHLTPEEYLRKKFLSRYKGNGELKSEEEKDVDRRVLENLYREDGTLKKYSELLLEKADMMRELRGLKAPVSRSFCKQCNLNFRDHPVCPNCSIILHNGKTCDCLTTKRKYYTKLCNDITD